MSTPSAAAQLRERARAPDVLERADIPWLHALEPNERERALADLKVVQVEPGELLPEERLQTAKRIHQQGDIRPFVGQTTKGCNGCHASSGFPYIEYSLPAAAATSLKLTP